MIEIMVVIATISIVLVNILGVATYSLRFSTTIRETTQANMLAQEVIEATRNFRDGKTWDEGGIGTLTLDTPYHPEKIGDLNPAWNLVLGEETVSGFTRKIVFSSVFRDANDNIVQSGNEDLGTKKVTATVSWGSRKVELITYITNWR